MVFIGSRSVSFDRIRIPDPAQLLVRIRIQGNYTDPDPQHWHLDQVAFFNYVSSYGQWLAWAQSQLSALSCCLFLLRCQWAVDKQTNIFLSAMLLKLVYPCTVFMPAFLYLELPLFYKCIIVQDSQERCWCRQYMCVVQLLAIVTCAGTRLLLICTTVASAVTHAK